MVVLDGKVTSAKIRQELALKVKELKAQGKKIGITFSTFDLLHAGRHLMIFTCTYVPL